MQHHSKQLVPLLAGALLLAACSDRQHPVAPNDPTASANVAQAGHGAPWSVAFVSTRSGNPDIFLMNPGGTDQPGTDAPRNLTADNPGADQWPAWSRDGHLAFSSARDGHTNLEIYVMNAEGRDVRRITTTTTANIQPAWSPNSRMIAFVRGTGPTDVPSFTQGSRQIWVHDMKTGLERQLTHAGDNYHPSWSPDGKQIIFASDRNGDFSTPAPEKSANFGLYDIYIMSAEKGDAVLTRVTNNPTSLDGEPSFSPNGKMITFRTRRETAVDPDGVTRHWCTIAVANVTGGDIRYLTPKPANLPSTQWCNAFPAWSHDGKEIYFHSARFGIPLDIYAVGVDGTGLRRLTYDPAAETAPAARW